MPAVDSIQDGPNSAFFWLDNPPVVAGSPAPRVGLLALNYQVRGLGVDILGGLTTLGEVPFNGTRAEVFLERFTSSGVQSWVRHGVCNQALVGLSLHVDSSGQSLLAAGFSDGCNWEGSLLQSAEDPLPVSGSFTDDPTAQSAIAPSQDVFVVAHSDHGSSRGFAQLGGVGRQSVRALFTPPQAWAESSPSDAGAQPRSQFRVGLLLDFEANLDVAAQSFTSSRGGVGSDTLFTRADAAPLGSEAEDATELKLGFGHSLQLAGSNIAQVAARDDLLLIAGTGALPIASDSDAPPQPPSNAADRGWLAALNAEGEVSELAAWQPAFSPLALVAAPDGSTYAAFDHMDLQFEAATPINKDGGADAGAGAGAGAAPVAVSSVGYNVVRFDAEGRFEWQRGFPTQALHSVHLAATDTALAVWGSHLGSVGIGDFIATSAVGDVANALVMTLNPDGSVFSLQHWGSAAGSDAALQPVPHPAGGFIGILNLSAPDIVRQVPSGSYLLWVPN
jgi:hypothetical protein